MLVGKSAESAADLSTSGYLWNTSNFNGIVSQIGPGVSAEKEEMGAANVLKSDRVRVVSLIQEENEESTARAAVTHSSAGMCIHL